MSCIHYKFKSSLDYDTLTFDGTHISLGDLKKAIITQKKLQGKANEFELQITNAQSKDGEYDIEIHRIKTPTTVGDRPSIKGYPSFERASLN